MPQVTQEASETLAQAQYLSITRNAGLPDELAMETYKENKESADKLAEFKLRSDLKQGEFAKKLIKDTAPKDVEGIGGQRLKAFIERIERLEEEKSALLADIKEIYAEAKSTGFDAPTIRKVIQARKLDTQKRNEQMELFEIYSSAIGM